MVNPDCEHLLNHIVARRDRGSGRSCVAYYRQCPDCGWSSRPLRPVWIPGGVPDRPPSFDELLDQAYREMMIIQVAARRASWLEATDLLERRRRFDRLYVLYIRRPAPAWEDRRDLAFARCCRVCEVCHNPRRRCNSVHHKTYANLGDEPLTDLLALCIPCHELQPSLEVGLPVIRSRYYGVGWVRDGWRGRVFFDNRWHEYGIHNTECHAYQAIRAGREIILGPRVRR